MTDYVVDFSHNSVDAPDVFVPVSQKVVAGVPSYLAGQAMLAHVQARLLHENPLFRRIRDLTVRDERVATAGSAKS
ncbi:MAG: hypothetical protein ACRYHA_09550 [Janthinobacterium lividum]